MLFKVCVVANGRPRTYYIACDSIEQAIRQAQAQSDVVGILSVTDLTSDSDSYVIIVAEEPPNASV